MPPPGYPDSSSGLSGRQHGLERRRLWPPQEETANPKHQAANQPQDPRPFLQRPYVGFVPIAFSLLRRLSIERDSTHIRTGRLCQARHLVRRCEAPPYPGTTFTSRCRLLGPSNSQKKMPCQVPRTSLPPSTNSVSEMPTRLALMCAGELPSACR